MFQNDNRGNYVNRSFAYVLLKLIFDGEILPKALLKVCYKIKFQRKFKIFFFLSECYQAFIFDTCRHSKSTQEKIQSLLWQMRALTGIGCAWFNRLSIISGTYA
jgi:hypothetical protein